ncbi:hypothetical protein [Nostoc sp. CCY 9925]|uniref:hypothetical protein n=1 Tax=Nostoc sp. CCY 9925 TaxID=3103865 RepID=UPI0039C67A73
MGMTPAIYEEITTALKRENLPLTKVCELAKNSGSNWSETQVHLFLACMDGVEVDTVSEDLPLVRLGQRTEKEELVEAIIQVVNSNTGKPISAAEIRRKLPGKFTTTEAQIKALAKETPVLEVFGPGLIRYKG